MPGLVPGIHALFCFIKKDVDGRDKPGHDEFGVQPQFNLPPRDTIYEA
jgi:hypothetical protein